MFRTTTTVRPMLAAAVIVAGFATAGKAATYNLQPTPADLYDLNHYKYYVWVPDWQTPADENIVGASLFFDNIRNWDNNQNVLYVHLIDLSRQVSPGVYQGRDNQGGGDAFAGMGDKLFEWHNLPSTPQDLTYNFTADERAALESFAADGNFALAFDPDCHFYNDGVTLTIQTQPGGTAIPLPASAPMGLVLLAGLAIARRFRRV